MPRTMRTFFEPDFTESEDVILLDEFESHHLCKVLRLQKGDSIEALDGKGNRYFTEILGVDRKCVELRILDKEFSAPLQPAFRLAVALPKGNRWEDLIRPLTELGVAQLTPLITDHSESKNATKKQDVKVQKWQKIAIDACKQSGNPWLPHFDLPQTFSFFLSTIQKGERILIGSLSQTSVPMKKLKIETPDRISVLIGPEGGWSNKEELLGEENGFISFSLGLNTLRLETAAICGLAVARESFIL
ncbi:MAG: RsmE family RNA methyltransferase [Opitutales bacterium]|nr:RsmE family RNA methyltransferase [Opitutales bacterium]